jgi:hypothetical protein
MTRIAFLAATARPEARVPWNPEKYPCFPRARQAEGEYNQEEEKIGVSVCLPVDVQCGQR